MKNMMVCLVLALSSAAFAAPFAETVEVPGVGAVEITCGDADGWSFSAAPSVATDGTSELAVSLAAEKELAPPKFSVRFEVPQCDTWHRWAAPLEQPGMPPAWKSKVESRLSSPHI